MKSTKEGKEFNKDQCPENTVHITWLELSNLDVEQAFMLRLFDGDTRKNTKTVENPCLDFCILAPYLQSKITLCCITKEDIDKIQKELEVIKKLL